MAATVDELGREATLSFKVAYLTVWGQHVAVTGPSVALGEDSPDKAVALSCSHEGEVLVWQGSMSLAAGTTEARPAA